MSLVNAVSNRSQTSIGGNTAQVLRQHHVLKYGSSGTQVSKLQNALKSRGLYNGPVDGKFGPLTQQGVRDYQKQNQLQVDGVVGQQTWGKMLLNQNLPPGTSMLGRPPLQVVKDGYSPRQQGNKYAPASDSKIPSTGGKLNGIPPELSRYGNGRIPAGALKPVGVGNHRLYGPAADALKKMRADAAAQGVHIGVSDTYRSYSAQVDVARRKGLYSQGGLAATPGRSKHGWGLAVDLKLSSSAQAWMRANAQRYGFYSNVRREPWHWEYKGA